MADDSNDSIEPQNGEIAFYCHSCHRSFLSNQPKCPFCEGEFVEMIAADMALQLDFGGEEAADETTSNSIRDPATIFQDLLNRHLASHTNSLRERHPGVNEEVLRRHIDETLRAHARANESQGTEDEEHENEDIDVDDNTETEEDQVDSELEEGGTTRTMRIPLGGGNEMIIVVTSDAPNLFNLPNIFTPGPGTQQESVLHPLLRLFGFAGDPRDYVNDPQRFADLLDRLFQASEGHTQGMPVEAIAKLPRVPSTEEGNCPVCMDPLAASQNNETPTMCIKLACGHCFHEGCLVPWLERCASCPVCRAKQSEK
jgi:hypothetical protein